MKKIILLTLLIMLSIGQPLYAATPTKKTTTETKVEYVLPYPGILPTNPLYFLKNFRDWIIESLITDASKKAEFYILQADKKLNMALFLEGLKKEDHMKRALADAQALREKAVVQLEGVQKAGNEVPRFIIEKYTLSVAKHIEVVQGLKLGVDALSALLKRGQLLFSGTN